MDSNIATNLNLNNYPKYFCFWVHFTSKKGKGTMFSVLTVTTLPSFPWQKCTVRQQLYQKPGGHQYSACLYYSAILSQSTQLKSNPDIHCHSVTLSQSTFSETSWCGLSLCHIVTEYTALKNLGCGLSQCHIVTEYTPLSHCHRVQSTK